MKELFDTQVLIPTNENIEYAAKLLCEGETIGMPTETVYGLAANAFDENAVEKIFIAKGRPQDNPLIVHIDSLEMLKELVTEITPTALALAKKFWPGPLTMIFEKSDRIPLSVTAGLSSVAIRFPSNKVAQRLITACGLPLAAPSANISGSPNPTSANHVYTDMDGKIPAILDGGLCEVGLESTVVLLKGESLVLLRPGYVTIDMLKEVVPNVTIADGVLNELDEDAQVLSPGMKHKHYSPKADVCILDGDFEQFKNYVCKASKDKDVKIGAMVFNGEEEFLDVPCVTFGEAGDNIIQAKMLFSSLRALDELKVDKIFARMPDQDGVGLAIYNRLIRAAGFSILKL
ncbi:MAG: L-threonylcarbamoyladenylate synthase [Oscillospiraceae bacterium]